ncbi:MAG: crossover junction endodeoxyribonuclease RuvC [Oscillospiraceae bacterium]|nr:crossover junction endodeoxyribonuclease RuvC [Oscillospiraceae bacterium]
MKVRRIIGIDPGYAIVGWGVVDYSGSRFKAVAYGAITTSPDLPFEQRLEEIYDQLGLLFERHAPEEMGIEKLYFTKNVTTGIDVAGARGVVLLRARKYGISIGEYTPMQVKQSVVGYGKAEKNQVMQMTKTMLALPALPKPDDVADALAVAICHAHSTSSHFPLSPR